MFDLYKLAYYGDNSTSAKLDFAVKIGGGLIVEVGLLARECDTVNTVVIIFSILMMTYSFLRIR